MIDLASELSKVCTEAAQDGVDFPTIWETLLKKHQLVVGPPVQTFEDERPHLDMPLSNGFCLRYCSSSNDFSIYRGRRHRAF
jgi:hypothetical protein